MNKWACMAYELKSSKVFHLPNNYGLEIDPKHFTTEFFLKIVLIKVFTGRLTA